MTQLRMPMMKPRSMINGQKKKKISIHMLSLQQQPRPVAASIHSIHGQHQRQRCGK